MSRTSRALGLLLVLSACGGTTDSSAVTGVETTLPPVLTTSTEPALAPTPSTTTAPVETSAETTTTTSAAPPAATTPVTSTTPPATPAPSPTDPSEAPTKGELVLRSGGVGPFTFGSVGPTEFIAAVTPALGPPTADGELAYPDDAGGYFENVGAEAGFAFPFGRTTCFSNAFCAHFGGSSADALSLVGYDQDENAGALATPSGVTSGSIWADFAPVIEIGEGGCFTAGYGTADGVGITVLSLGDWFQFYDDETGEYVNQVPAQTDVKVISLRSGEQPFFLYDDC
ncbi:MAG: hypothetical protein HKN44_13430 [Ilumatobacter sp.]|nr:hypothetical protein [Ilumatobacter sp.]